MRFVIQHADGPVYWTGRGWTTDPAGAKPFINEVDAWQHGYHVITDAPVTAWAAVPAPAEVAA